MRPEVGAVGAKLYYPDGTIQHGGVVLGIGGVASHVHQFLPANAGGYQGRARLTQRMSAVTAACLAGRKEIYQQVGGMDEVNLKVAFNDVDLCLKLVSQGYAVIWTPGAELYHHESASRGADREPEKAARFSEELAWMIRQWEKELLADAAYNRYLSLHSPGFRLNTSPLVR
jgi:GT2 family glycosyltransferase